MKVYIVYFYSDRHYDHDLKGIFKTKELAQEFIDSRLEDYTGRELEDQRKSYDIIEEKVIGRKRSKM